MPNDTEFTHSLFDNTALSSWNSPTLHAVTPLHESDDVDEAGNTAPPPPEPAARGSNFRLAGDRALARSWPARAHDNVAAISLSKLLEQSGRAPTAHEQAQLLRFTGFGATDLAQNCFRRPGEDAFRPDWQEIGAAIEDAVTPVEYAALQRATQYAHYTPETIIRGLWRVALRLGFTGGRVLEPGMGTGLFFALLPEVLREATHLTGIEYDPITARIARLVHPEAVVRCEDYARSDLTGRFDLVIGNPPFSDRVVRADPVTRSLGLRLHDYFIARSIARLRPGGIALFVSSTGTMDKAGTTAREYIAGMADLVGAVRLPEGSMRASAGTEVVVDLLVFQRRAEGQPPVGAAWIDLAEVRNAGADDSGYPGSSVIRVNCYFAEHPEMVLGDHALQRGIYGTSPAYTCRSRADGVTLETLLTEALDRLPAGIVAASSESVPPESRADNDDEAGTVAQVGTAADGASIKEGSFLIGENDLLTQITDGVAHPVVVKAGRAGDGILAHDATIIRALLPIRDAVREVLRAQAADQPWTEAQVRLRIAHSNFVRGFGLINHTVVAVTTDPETGEERETHRRPNLAPFTDEPDRWLVASIEDYDLESGLARMGPIFRERVIAPPSAPLIATAADALAVTLNATGRVTLPGASSIIRLYDHQKRVIWRIVAAGSTYIAHTVGAGKSYAIAGAIMEQKRLGLIGKAMLVVPGHCLAQVSREFLQLYPTARILVADETNFVKAKRSRFLARAATANWDAVIITHAAFRFIPVPTGFERDMIAEQIEACEAIASRADDGDRITRKRLEAIKEKLAEKLAALKGRRDDMVTLEEIGIDQIIVDEAQEFRKLTFATNQVNLKGVDPDGSQRAWDLFVKARYLDCKRPGRALIQASGTPITNTLGEMYTQRKAAGAALLTKIRLAARERIRRTWTVGRIGGFDLTCAIESSLRDGRPEPNLTLERAEFAQVIDIDIETRAVGVIARLEHALHRMEAELEEHRRRGTDAKVRLAGYTPRLGEVFPLQTDLDDKRAQLASFCGGGMRTRSTGGHEDADGMAVEPFALHDNLMLAGGVIASGGCVIVKAAPDTERYTSLVAFERCAAQAAAALLR